MNKRLLASMLLAGGTLLVQSGYGQISLGIRIGPPPAPRVICGSAPCAWAGLHMGRGVLVSR